MTTHKDKIKEALKGHDRGLTIEDLSQLLKVTRMTISVALAELKGEKKITINTVEVPKDNSAEEYGNWYASRMRKR